MVVSVCKWQAGNPVIATHRLSPPATANTHPAHSHCRLLSAYFPAYWSLNVFSPSYAAGCIVVGSVGEWKSVLDVCAAVYRSLALT